MLQIALTILIYLILVIPAGVYVYHIAAGKHTFADPVFNRVDGAIYKVCGVNPKNGMNWKKYAVSLVITNGIMILLGYIILRIQSIGLFNPNGIGAMEESLSFNTIISFMTNTNLQHYSGESGLSNLSPVSYTHLDVYKRQPLHAAVRPAPAQTARARTSPAFPLDGMASHLASAAHPGDCDTSFLRYTAQSYSL